MAMMKAVFGLCVVFILHQEAASKATTSSTEKLALVSESYVRDDKRQMELLPDELPIDIETENEKAHIHLTKQKNIDLEKIKLTVFDSELVEKPHVSKRIVGYYQDRTNAAVIAVSAKQTNDKVLRTLEGSLVLNDKAYEICPDQEGRSILSTLLQERDNNINANVHVLKEVKLEDFFKPINYDVKRHEERIKNYQTVDQGTKDKERKSMNTDQETFHVEIKFLLDWSIYEYWYAATGFDDSEAEDLIQYYFVHIFNGMSMAYRRIEDDPRHNLKIILWLNEIIITKNKEESWFTADAMEGDVVQTSKSFNLLNTYRTKHNYTWNDPDHLSVWTRKDMKYLDTKIFGIADLCGICENKYSSSFNNEVGLFSWATGAHELAHILGSQHDGEGNNVCNEHDMFLMTSQPLNMTKTLNALSFSDCTVKQMKSCVAGTFDYGYYNAYIPRWPRVCVYDTVCEHQHELEGVDWLPGDRFSLDEQCNNINTNWKYNAASCPSLDICKSIRCHDIHTGVCASHTKELKAAAGTPCSSLYPNMVCYAGQCVDKDTLTKETENFPCSDEKETVPNGCTDISDTSDCQYVIGVQPYSCFLQKQFYSDCAASCHAAGLYKAGYSPCEIVTNDVRDTIVKTLAKDLQSLDEQPKYCVPMYTYSPNLKTYHDDYGMLCLIQVDIRCPSSQSQCVPPTKMCDTVADCPNGEDEDEQFCRKLSSGRPGYIRHPYDAYKLVKECDCQKAVDDPVYVNDPAYTKPVDYCEQLPKYCPYEIFGGINCPNKPWECIGPNVACDGVNDCGASNGEVGDETLEFCASLCEVGEFKCPGNEEMRCVPAHYACDDYVDCVDGRDENRTFCDELSLIMNLTIVCNDGEVKCNGSMECIPESWLCDSMSDCLYAADEKDCPGTDKNCTLGEISCPNAEGICIAIWKMCDGFNNCPDSLDEDKSYCNNQTVAVCPDDGVNCPGRPYGCIPSNWTCDGIDDCGDYSDEQACTPVTCPVSPVACPDTLFCEVQCPGSPHICVPEVYLCDNVKDCYGDEETALCNTLPPADCDQFGLDLSEVYYYEYYYYYYPYSTPEYVACPGFNARCVPKDYICDQYEDCYDGVDEANCIVEKEKAHQQIRKHSREISYIKTRREEHEQSIRSRKEKRHEVTLQRKEQKEHANTQRKVMWQHNKSQREERKKSIQSRWKQRTSEFQKELRSPVHAERAVQEMERTRP